MALVIGIFLAFALSKVMPPSAAIVISAFVTIYMSQGESEWRKNQEAKNS